MNTEPTASELQSALKWYIQHDRRACDLLHRIIAGVPSAISEAKEFIRTAKDFPKVPLECLTDAKKLVRCDTCGRLLPVTFFLLVDANICMDCAFDTPPTLDQSALKQQHGGSHYKDMKIQPVEFITANHIPFIEGSVIAYVCRHRKKDGANAIKKAIHFLELLLQLEYDEKP